MVYMVYYSQTHYIHQGTCGLYSVLHSYTLHPPGYLWSIWSTTLQDTTSTRVPVVYMVYYTPINYIHQGTCGLLHSYKLHPPGYLWSVWSTTVSHTTSTRVPVVYMVYYTLVYYIHQGTRGLYGLLQSNTLHPSGYLWFI